MGTQEADFIKRDHCINCNSTNLKELSGGLLGDSPVRELIEKDPWGENPMPYIENRKWSYVRCADCSQMFHKYVLSPYWNEILYTSWVTREAIEKFEKLIHKNKPEYRFRKAERYVGHILCIEKLTRNIRKDKAVHMLDFGCGWGDFLATADCFGFIGYGIDHSTDRRRFGQHVSVFENIEKLLTKKDGQNNMRFHAVTLFEVLEHLDNPLSILQSLNKLMLHGAVLVLETPDCTGVSDINGDISYRKIHPLSHINAFTKDTLVSIAKRAGFKKVRPCMSHVTVDRKRVVKSELKQLLYLTNRSTQQYFRKI